MFDFYRLKTPNTPLVISHRGLSSLSTILGLQYGDFSELDVMLTLDLEMVVFHDNYLSRVTNVSEFPEFASKKRVAKDYDEVRNDWWISDFTLEDLRKLRLRQGQEIAKRPGLWNWNYSIPTLREFLESLLAYKDNRKNKKSGLMIQLKEQDGIRPQQLVNPFIKLLQQLKLSSKEQANLLNLPILVASFNEQMIIQISTQVDLPLLQLIDDNQKYNLENYSKICAAIGLSEKTLKDCNFSIIKQAHGKNLSVMYWTIRTDSEKIPFECRNYDEVQIKLIKEGIDGLITQFPETTATIIRMMRYMS